MTLCDKYLDRHRYFCQVFYPIQVMSVHLFLLLILLGINKVACIENKLNL